MNAVDWVVLLGTIVGIAAYGAWRTRHVRSLNTYLRGNASTGWGTIGLSVMATQASAITYLSIPGQGFESGLGFVQNYFGLPLALIINELLTNAAKHGRRGDGDAAAIRIALTPEHLRVEDDGPGFDLTEARKRGSGLGLVQGLATQLGARLEVERSPGARCILRFSES